MKDINCWQAKFELCPYSVKLLDKLLVLNEQATTKVGLTEVKKAIYYAKKYHGEQKRQSGEPYYSHPLEVAYRVADYLFKTDIIVTSILHDTLEDTTLTFEIIEHSFGLAVANQVLDLTRIKADGQKISSAQLVELLWHQKKYELLLIKQFDRLHNVLTIAAKSPEKISKTIQETINSFTILAAYLGIKDVEKELIELCSLFIDKQHHNKNSITKKDARLFALMFQNDKRCIKK